MTGDTRSNMHPLYTGEGELPCSKKSICSLYNTLVLAISPMLQRIEPQMGQNEEKVNMRQSIMRNNMLFDSRYQGWATSSVAGTVIPISRMTSQVWRGCSEPEIDI